jgi:putative peptide zinc metalloprotease protein
LLGYLCLNVMFVCSVSTLLFNANPLMRYDGYYILSDLLEIPNLRHKASAILQRQVSGWLLGLTQPPDPFLPKRHQLLFATYSVLAACYRWVVVVGILWFVYHVFEPYGLRVVGQAITAIALYGLIVQPLIKVVRFFQIPGRREQVNRFRLAASLIGMAAILAMVFGVPTPHYVVTLENVDVDLAVARLFGQQQQLISRFAAMRQRAFADESAVNELGEIKETLAGITQQLENRLQQKRKTRIVASRDGFVIPVVEAQPAAAGNELSTWSGSPLDRRNTQAYLRTGELICRIGDPRKLSAIFAIDQGDVEFVQPGQPVDIVLDAFPTVRQRTHVSAVAQLDQETSRSSLSFKGSREPESQSVAQRAGPPISTSYQASADLDDVAGQLFHGATGRARIRVGHQTVAQRAWRLVCQTFRFDV